MNITFLVGNGFDLNLGLRTTYLDFIKQYKSTPASESHLIDLRRNMDENEKLWSDAELAFGQYTRRFLETEADKFLDCQEDFCMHLVTYLKKEEEILLNSYSERKKDIQATFQNLDSELLRFPSAEKDRIQVVYNRYSDSKVIYNFITYNYTRVLDEYVNSLCKEGVVLGNHTSPKGVICNHVLGNVVHVHGTVDKDMVFGVNDESQIANLKLFSQDEYYKNFLIKVSANKMYQENMDAKVHDLLVKSQIIVIYGMSLGATDNIWWNRINDWLEGSQDRHLLVYYHNAPEREAFPRRYIDFERKKKAEIASLRSKRREAAKTVESQIHIISHNLFEGIENLAKIKELGDEYNKFLRNDIGEHAPALR